jgi:Fe-S-cluster-containing hydrogenase component 2
LAHQSILAYARYRYLKLATAVVVVSIAAYAWDRPPNGRYGGTWLVGDELGKETKVYDKSMVKKAVKRDMCKDVTGGAACVRACPAGATLRVSPEKFLDYTNAVEH